jgi:hypothetical protein
MAHTPLGHNPPIRRPALGCQENELTHLLHLVRDRVRSSTSSMGQKIEIDDVQKIKGPARFARKGKSFVNR